MSPRRLGQPWLSTDSLRSVATTTAFIAAFLVTSTVLVASPASAVQSESELPQQAIDSLTQNSVVYLEITERGVVQVPLDNGSVVTTGPYDATFTCTGFITGATGYIATAGHCVDSTDEGHGFARAILEQAHESGQIGEEQYLSASAMGESGRPGVDITSTSVFLPSNSTTSNKVPAAIVEDVPPSGGDVALLKVQTPTPLPALQLAGSEPVNGDAVTVCGYPHNVALATGKSADPNQPPSLKVGHVSAIHSQGGAPFIQTDAAISEGMSGGPMVDDQGNVIGVVSSVAKGPQAFNFAADLSTLRALLVRHAATTPPTDGDQALRDGLKAFYSADYHGAVVAFDTVLKEQPGNSKAQDLRSKAVAVDPNAASPLGIAPVLLWGTTLAAVAILGLGCWLLRRRWTRNNRTATPHAAGGYADPYSTTHHGPSSTNSSGAANSNSGPSGGGTPSGSEKSRVPERDSSEWWTEDSTGGATGEDDWWKS